MSPEGLVSVLHDAANALVYLHKNDILHGDLRPENIVVRDDSYSPVLIDYGLSKSFTKQDTALTRLFIDPEPLPKDIQTLLDKLSPTRTYDPQTLKPVLFPWLDLFQFGLLTKRLQDALKPVPFDRFTSEYLMLLANNLLDWRASLSPANPAPSLAGVIRSSAQLHEHLSRLTLKSEYYAAHFAKSEKGPTRTIVRNTGTADLRESVSHFLSHPAIGRLHNINQLSLLYYVYPTATQSRFDHLISTLGRTQQVWRALASNAAFVFYMGPDDIDRLELAALHHDTNHFPFLHYFQEAGVQTVEKASVLDVFLDIDRAGTNRQEQTKLKNLLKGRGITPAELRDLLSDDLPIAPAPAKQIMKSIINSGVDVDKMAYLVDDAYYTGVPFGRGVDVHALLSEAEVAQVNTETGQNIWHIVFSADALPAVESICFARYWNFQRIYWHHTNRALAAMIIRTVRELYSTPSHTLERYLTETRDWGESGSLQYLADAYKKSFTRLSPLEGLASNRNQVYRRLFEMSFLHHADRFNALQNKDTGLRNREDAEKRVLRVVEAALKEMASGASVDPNEVLLDVPLRKMDLGGMIWIRNYDGVIQKGTLISATLRELERSFEVMGKVLRVFVSPRIQEQFGMSWDAVRAELRSKIYKAVTGDDTKTEIR
jgi:hypothetical protein